MGLQSDEVQLRIRQRARTVVSTRLHTRVLLKGGFVCLLLSFCKRNNTSHPSWPCCLAGFGTPGLSQSYQRYPQDYRWLPVFLQAGFRRPIPPCLWRDLQSLCL